MMELETPNDFDYLDNLTLAKADNSTQTIGLDEGFFDFKVAVSTNTIITTGFDTRSLFVGPGP